MAYFEHMKPEKQRALLLLTDAIINPEVAKKTYEQIADEAGISVSQLFRWRTQDKEFMEARKEIVQAYSSEMLSDAFAAIRYKLTRSKDMKAAELALRAQGMLIDRREVTGDINTKVDVESTNNEALADELARLREKLQGGKNE